MGQVVRTVMRAARQRACARVEWGKHAIICVMSWHVLAHESTYICAVCQAVPGCVWDPHSVVVVTVVWGSLQAPEYLSFAPTSFGTRFSGPAGRPHGLCHDMQLGCTCM